MKRFLWLITLCCLTFSMQAQKIVLDKFEQATFDLSASTKLRKDLNGHTCALVKVQFPHEGAVFEGNVIGPVEYKTGEYWVYMSSGSRRLTIKHPKFLPLMFEFVASGIKSLEKKTTYTMVLTSDAQEVPAEQTLTIRYQPTNAIVLVDSKIVQGQNGVATLTLPCGDHSYTVAADGYVSSEGTYKLRSEAPGVIRAYLEKEGAVQDGEISTPTSLDVRCLADSKDADSETTDFQDGDNLYVYLHAPRDGYLAGYLVDPVGKTAIRVLPYYNSSEETLFVYPDKPYVFFPENTNDGFVLTTQQNVEHNNMVFIFSPNAFYRSNMERRDPDTGLWQLSKSEFDKWVKRIRQRDAEMKVVEKEIVIRNK